MSRHPGRSQVAAGTGGAGEAARSVWCARTKRDARPTSQKEAPQVWTPSLLLVGTATEQRGQRCGQGARRRGRGQRRPSVGQGLGRVAHLLPPSSYAMAAAGAPVGSLSSGVRQRQLQ